MYFHVLPGRQAVWWYSVLPSYYAGVEVLGELVLFIVTWEDECVICAPSGRFIQLGLSFSFIYRFS